MLVTRGNQRWGKKGREINSHCLATKREALVVLFNHDEERKVRCIMHFYYYSLLLTLTTLKSCLFSEWV